MPHFFVWLLGALVVLLGAGLILGIIYASSSSLDLNTITFKKFFDVPLTNGSNVLWTSSPTNPAFLAQAESLRTFMFLAEWAFLNPTGFDSDPFYIPLPEVAKSIRTLTLLHVDIVIPAPYDNIVGELFDHGTKVSFRFSVGDVPGPIYFTKNQVTNGEQGLGVVIIYQT